MKKKKLLSKLNPLFFKGIAHRGYHNEENTENGLNAFQRAIDNNLAIEFDIHLTKDNELVVCHDEDLKRTTLKSGIIEDLTLKEIKDNYTLKDGTKVPTLKEVFDLVQEKVPMVIELKVFRKNYKELASRTREFLDANVKNKNNFMLISFDPRSLLPFKRYGIVRSLLVAESHYYVYRLFAPFFETYDVEQVLFKRKNSARIHKRKPMNVWTIKSTQELEKVIPYVDMVTFQDFSYQDVQKILRANNKY
ncbi:MAG: hypothetical protein HUJ61_02145 [Bacilli bacterium]|nr:hypothetical protein [Bacilli bacterium]